MTTELDDQLRALGALLMDFARPVTLDELSITGSPLMSTAELETDVSPTLIELSDVADSGRRHRRHRYIGVAALVGMAAGLVAVVSLRDPERPPIDGVGSLVPASPVPTSSAPSAMNSPLTLPGTASPGWPASITCDDYGCHGFDDLAVVTGASDFYVGPESLGEPTVHLGFFENLTRCALLTPNYSACAELEGIAAVNLVDYPGVSVGTTFAHVTPQDYAEQWGPSQGGGPTTPVTVRGHEAIRYLNEDLPAVVWEERPGVLAWVAVVPDQVDALLGIAEGIRAVPGPATIPHRVVGGDISTNPSVVRYDADDNDGDGLVIVRIGDAECVGFGFVDGCGDGIAANTVVRPRGDTIHLVGATPPNVVTVRFTFSDGGTVEAESGPFANYRSHFFSVGYSAGTGVDPATLGVVRVVWLDANGETLEQLDWATRLASSSPETTAVSVSG